MERYIMESFKIVNSYNTMPQVDFLDSQLQELKHYFEGYRETMLIKLVGKQNIDELGINTERYTLGSSSRASYERGRSQANFDITLLGELIANSKS